MKKISKTAILQLISVVLGAAMLILSCFFLNNIHKIYKIAAVLIFLSLSVIIPSLGDNHRTTIKILFVSLVFCAAVLVTYIILNETGILAKIKSFEHLKNMILSTKHWGIIVFLLLTIFQVVVLPIPAAVTILIGVAIYGPFWSFVLSTIGTYIGSFISFWLGRTFGKKLVEWMIGAEKTVKYADLIFEKGKFMFALMLLFPFFPDDILCMVAGVTGMTYKFFLPTVAITRPVMIAFTSFFGSGEIIPFSGWGIPVWIGLFVLCVALIFIFNYLKKHFKLSRGRLIRCELKCEAGREVSHCNKNQMTETKKESKEKRTKK